MKSPFAENDEEAASRFKQYKSIDPFPSVPPTLLSSAEIYDYVLTTGMVFPFEQDKLKPASYEVDFGGKVVYWDSKGEKIDESFASDGANQKQFTLYPNSIAFVQVRPKFRLPDYIAIRFNLKITHVYRGLLLGTGPLVDPGYEGDLFIPLHNLTANEYVFAAGEGLLWMEFTKLHWTNTEKVDELKRVGEYVEFPKRKKYKPLEYFFEKANQNKPIRSSIPIELASSRVAAESAKVAAESALLAAQGSQVASESAVESNLVIKWVGIMSVAVLILGIGALFYNTWNLVRTTQIDVRNDYKATQAQVEDQVQRIEDLKSKQEALEQEMKGLRKPPKAEPDTNK